MAWRNLLDKPHRVQVLQEQMDKWDIKIETFCTPKDAMTKSVNQSQWMWQSEWTKLTNIYMDNQKYWV